MNPRYNTLGRTKEWAGKNNAFIKGNRLPTLLGWFGTEEERDTFWKSGGRIYPPFNGNKNSKWGQDKETSGISSVLEILNENTTIELSKFRVLKNPAFSMNGKAGADPDGLIYEDGNLVGVVEIKCRSPYIRGVFANNVQPYTDIPAYYYPQIQLEMLVYGVHKNVVCSWTSGGCRIWEVPRNDKFLQDMLKTFSLIESGYKYGTLDSEECEMLLAAVRKNSEKEVNSLIPIYGK